MARWKKDDRTCHIAWRFRATCYGWQGVLLYGNIPGFYGFDFNTSEQTLPFIELIGKKGASLAQEPSPRGMDNALFHYIGVARMDEPGVVQIGIEPKAIMV